MGHTDITRIVKADRLPSYATSKQIADLAVRDWKDDPYEDRGSDNVWGVNQTAPSSEGAAWRFVEELRKGRPLDEAVVTPVPRDSDIITTTKTMTVKVTGALSESLRGNYSYEEREALVKQLEQETGKRVIQVEVEKFPARRKAKAVATDGKTVTVYDVVGVQPKWNQEKVVGESLETFPAAKAKAVEFAADPAYDRYSSFTVKARIQRVQEDGTVNPVMAVIARPVADVVTLTVKVTFESIKAAWKVDRYSVTFDIHH